MHTDTDLQEAHRAIASLLHKCEQALISQRPGSSQHTLLTRRIKALEISLGLIERELDTHDSAE